MYPPHPGEIEGDHLRSAVLSHSSVTCFLEKSWIEYSTGETYGQFIHIGITFQFRNTSFPLIDMHIVLNADRIILQTTDKYRSSLCCEIRIIAHKYNDIVCRFHC